MKMWAIAYLVVPLSLALAACAPSSPAPAETSAPTKAAQPAAPTAVAPAAQPTAVPKATGKTTLTVALNGEPAKLDPSQPVGRLNEIANTLLFDSITTRDAQGNLKPALAVSWNRLNDTTWQFKLRPSVKFHNGEEFNADTVKYNLEQLLLRPEANSPHRTFVQTIKQVDVVDPLTVNIVTNGPDVLLPARLSDLYGVMAPAKYYQQVGPEGFAQKPVGSGPFKFVEFQKDRYLKLATNDDYWGTKPPFKELILRPIVDDSARMAALLAGEVDIASNVPYVRVNDLKGNPNLQLVNAHTTRYYFGVFNTNVKPFDDKRVRQAVNYALDVDSIIKNLFIGYGTRIASVFNPSTFGYDPNIKPYPYDPAKAKQLLAEAGYPNGLDTEFDSFTGSLVDHSKLSEVIVSQLAQVGIRAKLNVSDFGVFGPRRLAFNTAAMYIYSLGDWAFDMGIHLPSYLEGSQGYYYKNKELFDKVAEANKTFDEAKRKAMFSDIQKDMKEDAPYIFLFQLDAIWGLGKNVQWAPPLDETWRFNTVTLK